MKTVRRIWRYIRAVAPERRADGARPATHTEGVTVERLMLAIGYNRSGSSLLGQPLNAYPEIVVARELYLLRSVRTSESKTSAGFSTCPKAFRAP